MNKALADKTLEELWELFPIKFIDHNKTFKTISHNKIIYHKLKYISI